MQATFPGVTRQCVLSLSLMCRMQALVNDKLLGLLSGVILVIIEANPQINWFLTDRLANEHSV